MFRKIVPVFILVFAAAAVLALAPSATASSPACDDRVNNTFGKLLECVTLDGVREHQAALQAIADANNGIRTSGTPGFDQSVAYAVSVFSAAGYNVTVQPFQFQTFISLSPSVLEQVAPPAGPLANSILAYSGSSDVTAAVTAPWRPRRSMQRRDVKPPTSPASRRATLP